MRIQHWIGREIERRKVSSSQQAMLDNCVRGARVLSKRERERESSGESEVGEEQLFNTFWLALPFFSCHVEMLPIGSNSQTHQQNQYRRVALGNLTSHKPQPYYSHHSNTRYTSNNHLCLILFIYFMNISFINFFFYIS